MIEMVPDQPETPLLQLNGERGFVFCAPGKMGGANVNFSGKIHSPRKDVPPNLPKCQSGCFRLSSVEVMAYEYKENEAPQ